MTLTSKTISFACILLIFATCLVLLRSQLPDSFLEGTSSKKAQVYYAEKYFDRNKIMQINIEISDQQWQEMIQQALKEQFHEANVTVNGDVYPLVYIRPKGNSSLHTISQSTFNEEGNRKRFSLKINFDSLNKSQTMAGLTQLNLNNGFADPSFMREYIGYGIFEKMGIPVPAFSYADVSVNGKYFGLYLAVESILEPYLARHFNDTSGVLYKSDGNTLTYTGDVKKDTSQMQIKNGSKKASSSNLMKMIKALNTGGYIEKYLDVDQALRYIAVSTALLNLDSYQGSFGHNYYLYELNGKFTILPWDLNMAFGGFQFGGNLDEYYIDEPTQGQVKYWPLIGKLLENKTYLDKYHEYLQEIVDKYLNNTFLEAEISRISALISDSVAEDPTALYSFEDFKNNTSLKVIKIEQTNVNILPAAEKVTPTVSSNKKKREKASFSQNTMPILSIALATADTIQKQLNGKRASTNQGKGTGSYMGFGPLVRQGNDRFPPPPGRIGQPPEGYMQPPGERMAPPMGGQPQGNAGKMSFDPQADRQQVIHAYQISVWFISGAGALIILAIIFLLFLAKRKWISA